MEGVPVPHNSFGDLSRGGNEIELQYRSAAHPTDLSVRNHSGCVCRLVAGAFAQGVDVWDFGVGFIFRNLIGARISQLHAVL